LAASTKLSRRAARRLISDGLVRRNGEVSRVLSRSVITGDVIDVGLSESELGVAAAPIPIATELLFEDRWILVASKPAGILSQPAEGRTPGDPRPFDQRTLLALAWRDGRRPYLRLVHRLDRMTSGAVLFARSPEVLPKLSCAWADGLVDRLYLAVIEGHPEADSFAIDRPISRDRNHRWRFECRDGGKPARTEVEVLAVIDDGLSIVGCRLTTGRTHQVRVHLAAAGHPVLGDRLYNSARADQVQRPLLHAAALGLPHPVTGDRLHVVCPSPTDLAIYLPEDLDLATL
jgi:23S rRNA pseudouridine1911/1915/1917 synthase